jgi:biopolymer transport protein ExbD
MARRRGKKEHDDNVPVDSFSDIAFLLIIFFIVAASLTQTMGFHTEIPASKTSSKEQKKTTSIKINNNTYFLNDSKATLEELEEHLIGLELPKKENPEDKIVMLELAGQADYQKFYSAMAAIATAGGTVAIVKEE